MHQRRGQVIRRCAVAIALAVMALATPAQAHQLGRSYCTVTTGPGGVDVTVETSFAHLQPVLAPLPTATDAEVGAAREPLAQALRRAVSARSTGGACTASAGSLELVTTEGQRAARLPLHFTCPAGKVTVRNVWRLDLDPRSESVCAIDGAAWVFRAGSEEREVGSPPTLGQVLTGFATLGVHHVLSGIDHLLFVVALLLAAARASRQHTLRRGLREVALIVTGFTLGHSVTLIAAGLGWVQIEPRVTESIIALSIVAVAVENVARREIRWRALTALAFGLVHGFGFASVLADTSLPPRGTVWALLSFNLGIELGQLAVVALLFVPLALSARRAWYERRLLWPASSMIAVLALVWLVKRSLALDFAPWLGG
ncbi:MAG: HupE/UreJ family protein [Polyangiaceae bacterium]|nr:HupE/UreJ family protein [Polyangiaceae bacterium]